MTRLLAPSRRARTRSLSPGAASKTVGSATCSTTFDEVAVDKGSSSACRDRGDRRSSALTAGGLTLTDRRSEDLEQFHRHAVHVGCQHHPLVVFPARPGGYGAMGGRCDGPAGMTWSVAGVLRISAGTVDAGSAGRRTRFRLDPARPLSWKEGISISRTRMSDDGR